MSIFKHKGGRFEKREKIVLIQLRKGATRKGKAR